MNNEKMHALVTLANDIRVGLFRLEDNRDLFYKLEGLGVELLGFFDEKISALLKWDSVAHHPIIAVNDQDSEKRQLFSLAHEIGHLFIDYGWPMRLDICSLIMAGYLNLIRHRMILIN